MSSSNCCFLTCIQISQEAGHVVWYSHLSQNFPQFIVIHTVRGNGLEEPPHARGQGRQPGRSTPIQGVVAVLAQEGLEELSYVEGQEGWR